MSHPSLMERLHAVNMADHQPTGVDAQLHVALDNMPGALVYTDKDLNIVVCNNRFKEMYPVPEELLQPRRPYADLLRYLAENGYYGEGDVDTLVGRRVESLRNPSGRSFEDHAPDGRWYRILRRRVGIAGGYATIGTIGFEGRLDYGAIGTVTNLAARLCGEAGDGQILISPRVFSKTETQIEVEPVGELTLKGFHRPVLACNVLRLRP